MGGGTAPVPSPAPQRLRAAKRRSRTPPPDAGPARECGGAELQSPLCGTPSSTSGSGAKRRRRVVPAAEAWRQIGEAKAVEHEGAVCQREGGQSGVELRIQLFTGRRLKIPGIRSAAPEWVDASMAATCDCTPVELGRPAQEALCSEDAQRVWRIGANRREEPEAFQRLRVVDMEEDEPAAQEHRRVVVEWNPKLAVRFAAGQLRFPPERITFTWSCVPAGDPSRARPVQARLEVAGELFPRPKKQEPLGTVTGPVRVLGHKPGWVQLRVVGGLEGWVPERTELGVASLSQLDQEPEAGAAEPDFRLRGCSRELLAAQPPRFTRFPLRADQLRSLRFMLDREANPADFPIQVTRHWAPGVPWDQQPENCEWPWVEGLRREDCWEKVSMRTGLPWCYETRMRATFSVAGGVLGDPIGSGKTATMIGLLDAQRNEARPLPLPPADAGRFIPAHGTLILVPSNLLRQWEAEFTRFLGKEPFKLLAVSSITDLRKVTAGDLARTEVVLASYKLLYSPDYIERLRSLQCTRANRLHERSFLGKPIERTLDEVERATAQFLSAEGGGASVGWALRPPGRLSQGDRAPEDLLTCEDLAERAETLGICGAWEDLQQPVFEIFYWHRIVFDEFHELEAMDRRRCSMLQHLRAHRRWGITGTPPTRDAVQIAELARIMRIELPAMDSDECQRFLDTFVRQNKADQSELPHIPVEEHQVLVRQTPEERALYLQQAHDGTRRNLLQFCSHHCFQQEETSGQCAVTTVARLREQKQQTLQHLRVELERELAVLQALSAGLRSAGTSKAEALALRKLEEVESNAVAAGFPEFCRAAAEAASSKASVADLADVALRHVDDSKPGSGALDAALRVLKTTGVQSNLAQLRAARASQLGRCTAALQKLLAAARSQRFLEATLSALGGADKKAAAPVECAVCMEAVTPDGGAVLPCAHVFHSHCARQLAAVAAAPAAPMCPTCRAPFRSVDVVELGSGPGAERPSPEVRLYGSKLAAVGSTLRQIAATDPGAKAIVFVQWRELELLVSATLDRMGVAHVRLRGPAAQRGRLLAEFQEREEPKVLLQSLENSASGVNLTRASHVLLVHPMDAESPERALAYEMQALGRVRRCGQQAERVHLWRFVTRGTIEEEITEERSRAVARSLAGGAPDGAGSR